MQTLLEIFYMRITNAEVSYRRKQISLSEVGQDPEHIIHSLIMRKYHTSAREIEAEFIIHSTSWRYSPPDQVILTYVAYSDELDFAQEEIRNLPLEELRTVSISTPRPLCPVELEKQVVSHAIRHLAFLVKTDHQHKLKHVLSASTIEAYESLWVTLAGRVF